MEERCYEGEGCGGEDGEEGCAAVVFEEEGEVGGRGEGEEGGWWGCHDL